MRSTNTGQAPWNDLSALRHKLSEHTHVLVVDSIDLLNAEFADLLAPEILAATFEPARVFAGFVEAEGIRRGARHIRQFTILGDGAARIWNIATGKFREDLFHRLSVVPIRVPSLAERREDIPELVEYFMTQISHATGLPKRNIGADAIAVLQSHDWPGNVRQLRNNVERLMILAGGDPDAAITAAMLPQDVSAMIPSMPNSNVTLMLMPR